MEKPWNGLLKEEELVSHLSTTSDAALNPGKHQLYLCISDCGFFVLFMLIITLVTFSFLQLMHMDVKLR